MIRALSALVAALAILTGCGYQLVHAPSDPLGPFAVIGGRALAPEAAAMAALEEGARAELARGGQLAPASAARGEIEVEVLRVDQGSEGIAAKPGEPPLARGLRITVIGRARLRPTGAATARDSGDLAASEVVARPPDAASWTVVRDEAARTAARRLGEKLVRRVLGFPEPGEP